MYSNLDTCLHVHIHPCEPMYLHVSNLSLSLSLSPSSLSPSLPNTSYCNTYMHILKLLMYKFLKTYLYTYVQVLPNAFDCLMYIYICIYIYMYTCIFICIYIYYMYIYMHTHHRRKFRSQTSDNMDRWKSRGGKSQRREEKKKEDHRRERVRGEKMQVREKVNKSRNTVFFQWFVAPEGRKVGSLKRRARSHLARWEMKNCTPLWREAHLEVKTYKGHHSRWWKSARCVVTHIHAEHFHSFKHSNILIFHNIVI